MVSENKLAAGPVLGTVGGFVTFAVGVFEIYLGVQLPTDISVNGFAASTAFIAGGAFGVLLGLGMMIVAVILWLLPERHLGLGAALIVLSILSLVSLEGGLGLGFLLGVLGGTCGIVFGPGPPVERDPNAGVYYRTPLSDEDALETRSVVREGGAVPPFVDAQGRTHRACPGCGRVSPIAFTICPQCGRSFDLDGTNPPVPP